MISLELLDYIKKTKRDFSKEQIKSALLGAGWQEADIEAAFTDSGSGADKKSFAFFALLFLFCVSIAFGGVFFGNRFLAVSNEALASRLQANILAIKADEAEKAAEIAENKRAVLFFAGDIMLARGVENIWRKNGDSRFPFLKIAEEIQKSDIAFANLEGPISQKGENQKIKYSFRFSPEVVDGLKFAGFDVLSLANNHIFDWGKEAVKDTVEILIENNIAPVGAGLNYLEANSPAILEAAGVKIAISAYETIEPFSKYADADKDRPGKSSFDLERVKNEIAGLKQLKIADIVVVSLHWGDEYQTRSNKKQREIGRALVEAGADLIVGHHPHVAQEIERYKNGWIAYSLGNFIFDQNFSEETMRGLMLKAIIQNKKIVEIEPVEIKINNSFQPEIIKSN